MNKSTLSLLNLGFFTMIFLLSSCQTGPYQPSAKVKAQVVPDVDISQFMGEWFVIASIPTPFEKDAYNGLETYVWNEKEQRIDISFTFRKGGFSGPRKVITQKGTLADPVGKSHWKVSPFWPLKFDFLIIDLGGLKEGEGYKWTTIGVPDKSYLWIMSRSPKMENEDFQKAKERAASLGYNLEDLKIVPQNGDKP